MGMACPVATITKIKNKEPMNSTAYFFNIYINMLSNLLNSSILFNTHIIDGMARVNKQNKQPIDRIKIGIRFPYGAFNFGDYSTTFSDLTLKGTRVRGLHASVEFGSLKIF